MHSLNRLVRETLPTGAKDYGYYPAGNLVSFADPGGEVTYAYDEVNLPVEVTGPDGATIELAYDDDNLREETASPAGRRSPRTATATAASPASPPTTSPGRR